MRYGLIKIIFILYILGGRLPIKFVSKNHQTSIPEDTPPGSVLLTTGVNKADSVGRRIYDDKNTDKSRCSL